MPKLLAAAIAAGLLVALIGRRVPLYLWAGLFTAGAVAGLGDFWKWGYEYGHHLDPHAAIRVPGMSYQPPLIGTKQLLNFHATSWPDIGGWIVIASLACVLAWRGWSGGGTRASARGLRRGRPAAARRDRGGAEARWYACRALLARVPPGPAANRRGPGRPGADVDRGPPPGPRPATRW